MSEKNQEIRHQLGVAPYCQIFIACKERVERAGFQNARTVRLVDLSEEERLGLANLHGWSTLPPKSFRLDLDALDQALRSSRLEAGLRDVLEALFGPLNNLKREKDRNRADRVSMWNDARHHSVIQFHPKLENWLDDIRSKGLLARAASVSGNSEKNLLMQALSIVSSLPARGEQLTIISGQHTGDPHALDPDRALSNLVLRAAAVLAGRKEMPQNAGERRLLWQEVGVECDTLSSQVLVFGLRPQGETWLARHLREASSIGLPRRLTLQELQNTWLTFSHGQDVYICENPSIVASAATTLGPASRPLVCLEGIPSVAAWQLFEMLDCAHVSLHFHGDFDAGGLRIGNLVIKKTTALPWRFKTKDYTNGISQILNLFSQGNDGLESVTLSENSLNIEVGWDPHLIPAMKKHLLALYEEVVVSELVADLQLDRREVVL